MKILRFILYSVTSFLFVVTIIFSLGSALCKFADLPKTSIIQIFGYLPFYWVLVLSIVTLPLLLLLKYYRTGLSYFAIMLLFTLLLHDFSFNFVNYRIPEDKSSYNKLNVLAYNVKYYSFGIEEIMKFIKASDYDVLLLSESVLTPEKLEYLKTNLPLYSVLTDNGHDLSLLSKYPVSDYKIIELPTYLASLSSGNDIDKLAEKGIHRSFVHAVINVNGTLVNVLSLRLIAGRAKDRSIGENIRWGKYLIGAQHNELSVFLSYFGSLKGPVIFGGDLNVPPNSGIVHEIKSYADDSYLDRHGFGSFTFKASHPTMRIDYVFHSKDVIVENSRVEKVELSDHYPVRVEFLIPKRVLNSLNQ